MRISICYQRSLVILNVYMLYAKVYTLMYVASVYALVILVIPRCVLVDISICICLYSDATYVCAWIYYVIGLALGIYII